MLKQGKADSLIVMKLDRLTRSVKDLGHLCEAYFSDGKPWSLLSVSDSIDTRSASGKLILNVLTSVAQWEREAIADRVREAMQHMKSQGVYLGAAPYGWKYTDELDEHGRRKLVEVPEEQAGIKRICELYETDMFVWQICEQLDAEKVPARGPHWHRATVYRVLRRAGYEDPDWKPRKSEPSRKQQEAKRKKEVVRDKAQAAVRAAELRAQGLSLRQIGEKLRSENFLPPRGELWHAASILDLLRNGAAARSAS
jgi:DNA invertase Pin-like site-specific DNA recombinase